MSFYLEQKLDENIRELQEIEDAITTLKEEKDKKEKKIVELKRDISLFKCTYHIYDIVKLLDISQDKKALMINNVDNLKIYSSSDIKNDIFNIEYKWQKEDGNPRLFMIKIPYRPGQLDPQISFNDNRKPRKKKCNIIELFKGIDYTSLETTLDSDLEQIKEVIPNFPEGGDMALLVLIYWYYFQYVNTSTQSKIIRNTYKRSKLVDVVSTLSSEDVARINAKKTMQDWSVIFSLRI